MASRKVQSHLRQTLIRRDQSVRQELAAAIRETGAQSNTAHKEVTSDWEHKPDFYTRYEIQPDLISMTTEARGKNKDIWNYVNSGTKPHEIRAVNVPFLKFQTGYSSKTKAPAKAHTGTGVSSGDWHSVPVVHHPGTVARKFTDAILDKLRPDFLRGVENAIRRGLARWPSNF